MNRNLSKKLNSFPKDYELNEETKLKIEMLLQEEIRNMESENIQRDWKGLMKKVINPVYVVFLVFIITILLISSDNIYLFQEGMNGSTGNVPKHEFIQNPIISDETELEESGYEEVVELATIWANALKTRDGKPRYEMMTDEAKEKFKQEQINRSGEDWNFIIGESSPWVVDFNIEIQDGKAQITYDLKTSVPEYYNSKESITFVKENGNLLVADFQILYENRLMEEENKKLNEGD